MFNNGFVKRVKNSEELSVNSKHLNQNGVKLLIKVGLLF